MLSQLVLSLIKLIKPAIVEWWKAKKLSPESSRALREINQMFVMQVLLFVLFFVSLEHGVSIFVHHTERLKEAAYVRREAEYREEKITRLTDENQFLREQYSKVVQALEHYTKQDAHKVIESLEEAGAISPKTESRRGKL